MTPLTPEELGVIGPEPFVGPMAPPPTVQSFMPKPGIAQALGPIAAAIATIVGGKSLAGAPAMGYARGQQAVDQQNLQRAELAQRDAMQQQAFQQQQMLRQQAEEQRRQQQLMGAMQTIKQRVGSIKDKGQYDQEIDAYAAMLQQAGYRMTPNQLRVTAPFVAPSAKQIAGDAVSAWLKNPANDALLKKDPTIVGRVMLRIDTNGDGVPENVPLLRAGELGGIQFAQDEQGQALAIKSDDPKIGTPFQEAYKNGLARFVAENKRQPEPKEKDAIYQAAVAEAKKSADTGEESAVALSPAGLDAAALNYAKTGQLPPMGMGKGGAAVRSKIINRAAEKYGGTDPLDIAANKSTYTANQASLTQLTKTANATEAFAKTASDNLDLALAQSANVARTNSKLVNRYLQWAQGELSPAEGLTQFETYIYTAAREYAKVTSGGAMSAQGLTDSAAREAAKLLNAAQSPRAFAAAAKAMKDDMANVRNNYKAQVSGLQQQMRGTGGAPPEAPTETPWTDVGGGILIRPKKP
jgi:hypothetical protein